VTRRSRAQSNKQVRSFILVVLRVSEPHVCFGRVCSRDRLNATRGGDQPALDPASEPAGQSEKGPAYFDRIGKPGPQLPAVSACRGLSSRALEHRLLHPTLLIDQKDIARRVIILCSHRWKLVTSLKMICEITPATFNQIRIPIPGHPGAGPHLSPHASITGVQSNTSII
jgi:hypothetical protein